VLFAIVLYKFGNDTNSTLLDLVKEVDGRQIMWMGDFNYPVYSRH